MANFGTFLKLKMLQISQIPLGSIRLMVKQSICFTIVGNSTVNTGFGNFAGFLGLFSLKFNQNSSKSYKMTFGMQRSMCEKVANFKSIKVSMQITLK